MNYEFTFTAYAGFYMYANRTLGMTRGHSTSIGIKLTNSRRINLRMACVVNHGIMPVNSRTDSINRTLSTRLGNLAPLDAIDRHLAAGNWMYVRNLSTRSGNNILPINRGIGKIRAVTTGVKSIIKRGFEKLQSISGGVLSTTARRSGVTRTTITSGGIISTRQRAIEVTKDVTAITELSAAPSFRNVEVVRSGGTISKIVGYDDLMNEIVAVTYWRVDAPVTRVTIWRFADGQRPGVDTWGTPYDFTSLRLTSCEINSNYDQPCMTASVVLEAPLSSTSDEYVVFKPMDRIKIEQGWEGSTLKPVFFGFIDTVVKDNPPKIQRLECRDILKLAESFYYIKSNHRLYSKDPVADFPGEGGQPEAERYVHVIIKNLLMDAGIPEHRIQLPPFGTPEYPYIVIGDNQYLEVVYESAMDAVKRICDVITYKLWADATGYIHMDVISTVASDTADLEFYSSIDTVSGERFYSTRRGTIEGIQSSVSDDLRNWVDIIGYSYYPEGATDIDDLVTIHGSFSGPSNYVPIPPEYRKAEVRDPLIDTEGKLNILGQKMIMDLNRLHYTATADVVAEPELKVGQTVHLEDGYTAAAGNYFLHGFSTVHDVNGYRAHLTCVGGIGEGSGGLDANVPPCAVLDYTVTATTVGGTTYYQLALDASGSYDPDGFDLTFKWECAGFDIAYGKKHVYETTATSLTFTLTLTDMGDPPMSRTLTPTITFKTGTDPGPDVATKSLFYASGTAVYTTDDGGASWVNFTLY